MTAVGRSSQPGLSLAIKRGKLDDAGVPIAAMLETAANYRAAYEAVTGQLTPDRQEVRGGTGGGSQQESALAAGQTLAKLRSNQTADHVAVLDRVCGEWRTAHSVAKIMRRHPHTIDRLLREALATAVRNRGAE